jgi:hypothetical protein
MPSIPYPIDGIVYDIDGSTVVSGAMVVVLNTTTHEKTSTTTNSLGQFILDLANLTSGYSNSDKTQITAFYGTDSGQRCLSKRHTVDIGTGSYAIGDMVLHSGTEPIITCSITFAAHTNSHSGNLYVTYYDRTNDNLAFRIEALAGTTQPLPFGYLGKVMAGGFIRIFEDDTSGRSNSVEVWK